MKILVCESFPAMVDEIEEIILGVYPNAEIIKVDGADKASDLLRDEQKTFDLVISSYLKTNGRFLHRFMKKLNLKVPVIYFSGLPQSRIEKELNCKVNYVSKDGTVIDLEKAIIAILGG